jgi:hypothetical protein
MPMGTRHVVHGTLRWTGHCWAVENDGGGTWRLMTRGRVEHLEGRRVTVTGVRCGFDMLDVATLEGAAAH